MTIDLEPLQEGEHSEHARVSRPGHLKLFSLFAAELGDGLLNAAANLGGDGVVRPGLVVQAAIQRPVSANERRQRLRYVRIHGARSFEAYLQDGPASGGQQRFILVKKRF